METLNSKARAVSQLWSARNEISRERKLFLEHFIVDFVPSDPDPEESFGDGQGQGPVIQPHADGPKFPDLFELK
jgi:hypothetical protein